MPVRYVVGASIAAVLIAGGCGSDSDSVATTDSAPATLGQLDDVSITAPPENFSGDPVRIEDVDGDGEVEVVDAEIIADEADADGDVVVTLVEESDGDSEEEADDGLNPLGGDDPEDKLMPDVVCMGLQDAQDEIQDRGVFFSKSEDATGDGRRQLWDRNWIVVAQEPEPGVSIGENEAVLYVVKTDEDNDC